MIFFMEDDLLKEFCLWKMIVYGRLLHYLLLLVALCLVTKFNMPDVVKRSESPEHARQNAPNGRNGEKGDIVKKSLKYLTDIELNIH